MDISTLANSFEQALTPAQVSANSEDLQIYGTDWTRSFKVNPALVVFPKSIEDVQSIVRTAIASSATLVPSGGRTGLSGGAVASNQEVVVSFERMNRILDFNPVDRLVRCEAGVITANLQEFATNNGLFYPVDFASSGSSHIGGNIATNAGGIRVIRYGLTRESVAGLKVVTGNGEVLDLNKGIIKNATGYDLRHLFIGSEGTLGFICEAEIRLLPSPPAQQVLVLGVRGLGAILEVLQTFQAHVNLSAFEFFSELAMRKVIHHRSGLQAPFETQCEYYTLLEFDKSDQEAALATFTKLADAGVVLDGVASNSEAQAASLWELREGISESIAPHTPYKNDVSVPIKEIPTFLSEVDELVNKHYPDFDICWYGHIGDGNLHLNILRPESLSIEAFYEKCHHISPLLFEKIQSRRGSISAEHGVGLLKRDFLDFSRSESEIVFMQQIKQTFDPHGIMNPGKLLAA